MNRDEMKQTNRSKLAGHATDQQPDELACLVQAFRNFANRTNSIHRHSSSAFTIQPEHRKAVVGVELSSSICAI